MKSLSAVATLLASLSLTTAPVFAAEPARPEMTSPAIPDAADTPWPGGTIQLDIDAGDTTRAAYKVTETIPLAPGTRNLTLLFPQWLPGNHGPRGPLAELVDLRFTVDGKPVTWRRDPVEVHAFHVDLPAGARQLVARFVHTSPLQPSEGRVTMTPDMLNLQWEKMSLYPAGHYVGRIRIRPSVTLPRGWTPGTSLDGQTNSANRWSWAETDYEELVDSPIFAGAYFRKFDLGHDVAMETVADTPELLELAPDNLGKLRELVDQALVLFGKAPFDHYDFLVALSSRIGGIGLEHLESSENQLEPRNFVDWKALDWDRNVLAHELVHSWNGKYRRPAGLWTPDYRTPMRDDLLWVYEGQTQFWGLVLAARSGVQQKDTVLDAIARAAAALAASPGRGWRSVEDTTFDPVFAARKPKPYASLARGEDYYWEGAMVWLEADQVIRQGTGGRKGLDDFAKAFFSYRDGTGPTLSYTFDDVVATLNGVYPFDWAAFLKERIYQPGRAAPYAGIEKAGYRVVFKDEPNSYDKALFDKYGSLDLTHSLGMTVSKEGEVSGVIWDGPAFNAGIVTGAKIVAVDGTVWSADAMTRAIRNAKGRKEPLQFVVQRGEKVMTVPVDYHGGMRWPWLESATPGKAGGLDRLLSPRRD
ncbi:peptidase M61 [Novosphingobium endophyticum]|uniref:Peptidase M61 n=1 Tax=Novosphingobium endophyticum TaxID=1955250 RepID=A0A916X6S0_9SPHN|nr:M61 family metallopeptidase [Novosphingobium endophyticum]GGC08320.1 peptidase M61 [Novosphingobium endophyticum]